MSDIIQIVDLDRVEGAPAQSYSELKDMVLANFAAMPGVNPKFIELAKRLSAHFPSRDGYAPGDPDARDIWPINPVRQVERYPGAVWNFGVPGVDALMVLYQVVKEGIDLGLTVLPNYLGLAVLPDGRVLPPEKKAQFDSFLDAAAAYQRPSTAIMRKRLRELFEKRLAPHGFAPMERPAGSEIDGCYRRDIGEGWQQLLFSLHNEGNKLRLKGELNGHWLGAQRIHDAAGVARPKRWGWDYSVNLRNLSSPVPLSGAVETPQQVETLLALIDQYMPRFDRARDPEGLASLVDNIGGDRYRKHELPPIIMLACDWYSRLLCLYVAGWIGVEELEKAFAKCTAYAQKELPDALYPAEDLDRLMKYVRERVKPRPPNGEASRA